MFTGIIEGLGTISQIKSSGQSRRMAINANYKLEDIKIGDSIAVNGACLTLVSFAEQRFEVDLSPETVTKTTLGKAKIGDLVNLERALRISDRIDGHLVSGHIDGIGTIKNRKTSENAIIITYHLPESIAQDIIKKGSVAVDGISLTVVSVSAREFTVAVIPHTLQVTTLSERRPGDPVNLEVDIVARYIQRLMATGQMSGKGLTERSLQEMGYSHST